jgi:energy-coupling factor transporter ATP-binding protein EcfA2
MADLPLAADRPAEALPDLAHVQGQEAARRALEVAAAGGHSLLLVGPMGWGKTTLARCLPGLLPSPTYAVVSLPFTVRPREVGEEVQRVGGGVLLLDE